MVLRQKLINVGPLARAILVVGAVTALVTGITFAQFDAGAEIEDNTLNSATAELLVDGSDANSVPTESEPGFDFDGLVPGAKSESHKFLLKNTGDVNLNINVYATHSNVSGEIDNNKVHFCFVHSATDEELCYSRDDMLESFNDLPGNPLTAEDTDETEEFEIYVKVDDNHPGSGFGVNAFDLIFTGEQESPEL